MLLKRTVKYEYCIMLHCTVRVIGKNFSRFIVHQEVLCKCFAHIQFIFLLQYFFAHHTDMPCHADVDWMS